METDLKDIKTKEQAREFAIEWQDTFQNENYDYAQLVYFSGIFTKLGKKFGLLKEFKENGII